MISLKFIIFILSNKYGQKTHNKNFILQEYLNPNTSDKGLTFGFTATKRIGNAVKRNRAKRIMRELARKVITKYGKKNSFYVLIAKSSIFDTTFESQKNELKEALDALGVKSLNSLLEEIGLGKRVGNVVARQMISFLNKEGEEKSSNNMSLEITGTEGLVVNYATCCKPIPGDSVIGHFTTNGLVVHQERCKNILSIREDPSQCFPVNWHEELQREFSTDIKILASDEPGLLATMAAAITNTSTNIESIHTQELDQGHIEFVITLQVKDRDQLAILIRKLRKLKNILSVQRIHDQEMREAQTLH